MCVNINELLVNLTSGRRFLRSAFEVLKEDCAWQQTVSEIIIQLSGYTKLKD